MKFYHVCRLPSHKQAQSGFAIILVMGLLLVAAAITATIMARQENETVWAPIEGSNKQIDDVSKAIAAYERKNHRLPLPAVRMEESGLLLHKEATSLVDAEYNLPSAVATALAAGATAYNGPGGIAYVSNDPADAGSVVLIGAIPTETLGLPHKAAEDSYGRLLTYAVTLASANPFTYENSDGAIVLNDSEGVEVANKLSYIVIAHGKEGAGAWNAKNRSVGRDCSGDKAGNGIKDAGKGGSSPLEEEITPMGVTGGGNSFGSVSDQGNCDENDATFIVHSVTLVAGDEYFDDQLLRGKKDKVAATINRPCAAQAITWGLDGMCSGLVPEPGLVHYTSVLEPREIVVEHDASVKQNHGCTKGKCNGPKPTKSEPQPAFGMEVAEPDVEPGAIEVEAEGTVSGSVTVSCNNGSLVLSKPVCTESGKKACQIPWGGQIAHGGSLYGAPGFTAWKHGPYQSPTATLWYPEEQDFHDHGYGHEFADVAAQACSANGGWGRCTVYTCSDGEFNPPITYNDQAQLWSAQQCPCTGVVAAASCTTPWGATVASGASVESHSPCSEKDSGGTKNTKGGKNSFETQEAVAEEKVIDDKIDDGSGGGSCDVITHTCNNGNFDIAIDKDRSASCNCGELGTIELPSDSQACSAEGQCVDCCVPSPGYDCPAVLPNCRCVGGQRVSEPNCQGGVLHEEI